MGNNCDAHCASWEHGPAAHQLSFSRGISLHHHRISEHITQMERGCINQTPHHGELKLSAPWGKLQRQCQNPTKYQQMSLGLEYILSVGIENKSTDFLLISMGELPSSASYAPILNNYSRYTLRGRKTKYPSKRKRKGKKLQNKQALVYFQEASEHLIKIICLDILQLQRTDEEK